jgi:hypothetical protein
LKEILQPEHHEKNNGRNHHQFNIVFFAMFLFALAGAAGCTRAVAAVDKNAAKFRAERITHTIPLQNFDDIGMPHLAHYPGEFRKVEGIELGKSYKTKSEGGEGGWTVFPTTIKISTDYGDYALKFDLGLTEDDWAFIKEPELQRIQPASREDAARIEKNRKVAAFYRKALEESLKNWDKNCGTLSSNKYNITLDIVTKGLYGEGVESPFVLHMESPEDRNDFRMRMSPGGLPTFNGFFDKYFEWATTAKDNNVTKYEKTIFKLQKDERVDEILFSRC